VSGTETIEVEHFNGGCSPSAVVILTHGLGDSARGWAQAALQLCSELPWTRWVLPSAPNMPVTLNGRMPMPAWYDIVGLSDRAAERCEGIEQSHEVLLRLATTELESQQLQGHAAGSGDSARLVLAGFSQGGAMSLYTALRWPDAHLPLPAGVLCMSGYLPLPDAHEAQLAAVGSGRVLQTPMLLCHGDADPMVRPEWSTATVEK
jgi:lysophospholipase-2